ncbi:hypothetical protein JANAI62_08600 [Jannaschia pagri]|uniref:Uncharacterized protein n=1 Tax=Jannaschia pagri TaxID=2829797 RepID=A0ABQ4NII7_9RHOB|nr:MULTISPECIES: hypothetical protein [unclassified Jannaschia]GIT89655.1 hypothetical protein JANAI61_01130 [Jannaschia sp. AI_61]GIT94237.1 hypothetical protein JANAI62_08600 [Jannaschia sp. AI_62]
MSDAAPEVGPFDEARLRAALPSAWSLATAVQWTADNPASGQCNVTAAVVHDLFGGEIRRTLLGDVWHYYNWIDGRRVDLTDSQFTAPGARFAAPEGYQDVPSHRAEALTGIPQREYDSLRAALVKALGT